jgi:hypothetical protein
MISAKNTIDSVKEKRVAQELHDGVLVLCSEMNLDSLKNSMMS